MFHALRVAGIVDETHDAKSIVLDVPPPLGGQFAYRAGQFLTIAVEHDGEQLRRCYSLASSPEEGGHKVTVKRVRGGRVSNWLHDHLRVGDELSVMRPEGRFVLDQADAPLVLFAGGSGITPVISLVKTALGTTGRRATVVYANRDESSIIFARELSALEQAHAGRLRVMHRLDDVHGLLDERAVRALAADARDASFYLCGPGPFMALLERALVAEGTPPERIRIERFTTAAATRPEGGVPSTTAEAMAAATVPAFLEVELAGQRHRVPYTPGSTLLQAARDGGLDAPSSCEEGFCGCCAAQLLDGQVVMTADDALNADEKRRGMILACQSRPRPGTERCAFRFVEG
jgi:3-ketosteroid 9alpha-monooxygenase subunit B